MPVVITFFGVVVTAAIGWFAARRSQYERVLNVLDFISSSAVADARDNLGTLVVRRNGNASHHLDDEHINSMVKDLFTMLWAFQRIHAVDRSIPAWPIFGPKRLLRDSTVAWVNYWSTNLDVVRTALGLDPAATSESDLGLVTLADAWQEAV
ncbi:hypothetical protein RD149_23130 [Gordonia westfalica]|uniref:DUF4760 domain-containing protein n=1 Tax=Gordonia westfalica TaxID=158898 RepID=A0ABU2GYV3_9ACTN|nr:hypothetical protein [Gordonia westfalica]MDS1116645.1 hypothetical protein [Gordonia westfalica]